MKRAGFVLALFLSCIAPAVAQTVVHFPSQAPGKSVQLDALLYEPAGTGNHPAVVFMHGCSGLWGATHEPKAREAAWAQLLLDRGYVVLMVDSFTPRRTRNMCSPATFDPGVYTARPYDAYAALAYLQSQPFVDPGRVAMMGWSEGGGAVLFTVGNNAPHRNSGFRAAIAFYPGSCNASRLGASWKSTVPLLVLIGEKDVWTPFGPCVLALESAKPQVQIEVYPGAYHDFDWPGAPVRELKAYRTRSGVVPITGENPAAHAAAAKLVPEFLEEHLGR